MPNCTLATGSLGALIKNVGPWIALGQLHKRDRAITAVVVRLPRRYRARLSFRVTTSQTTNTGDEVASSVMRVSEKPFCQCRAVVLCGEDGYFFKPSAT